MFQAPSYAFLLALLPIFWVWMSVATRVKRKRLERFVGQKTDRLIPDLKPWRRWLRGFFWSVGFLFLVVALMRPHYGQNIAKVHRRGHDVFIVMDTSKSMLARDVQPSRLAYAQSEVKALLEELKGDRLGLILFEGDAFVQCPLTLDYSAFSLFLDDVTVGLISRPGTNVSRAIQLACDNFSKKSKAREKIIVVFSDGESFEGDPVAAAQEAAKEGVVIYTVALGSEVGEPIPIYDGNNALVGYKKDSTNTVVLTKTNVALLRQIAQVSKGACLEGKGYGVSDGLSKLISKRDRYALGDAYNLSYNEKYQPFLFLSFLCFLLDFIIPDRRRFYAS